MNDCTVDLEYNETRMDLDFIFHI